ncbi:hypothetical protein BGZ82_003738, partial [Podila clonocystis]
QGSYRFDVDRKRSKPVWIRAEGQRDYPLRFQGSSRTGFKVCQILRYPSLSRQFLPGRSFNSNPALAHPGQCGC